MAASRNTPGVGFVSVDAHGYWPGGRYHVHHVVRSLALLPADERPGMRDVYWLEQDPQDHSFDEVRDALAPGVVIRPSGDLLARGWRKAVNMLRRRRDFADLFKRVGVDVLFPTSACEKPGVPMIYLLPDFQHRRLPELHMPELYNWFEENIRRKVEEAEIVVLSSKDALADFHRYLPEYVEKARLLHYASLPQPEWFALDPVTTARTKGLGENYFLVCNQFTAHKNHLTLFEAVRLLKARGEEVEIACTGQLTDYKSEDFAARLLHFIAVHGLERNIKLLGFLPRAEQMALLRGAKAIVQPSLFEGWSTAVEDAKSLARPIIVSDIEIHREKLDGLDATLVAPHDAEAWAQALLARRDDSARVTSEMEAQASEAARNRGLGCAREFVAVAREAVARFERRAQ